MGCSSKIKKSACSETYPKKLTKIEAKSIQNGTRIQKTYRKLWSFFDRFCFDLASQRAPIIQPILDFFGSVSAPGINLEAISLQKAAGAHVGRFFLWFLIVWRLFWDISSLILGKLSHVFFMDVEVPWSALYYFFSFFVHVATCLKSWISLHWPCKSHALFLCSPTLLSSSSSAHTFPLSLFGAGLPLQVIGGRGATGIRPAKNLCFGSFSEFQFRTCFLKALDAQTAPNWRSKSRPNL